MWAYFSMLKSTLKVYDNIDIGTYNKLSGFLKAKSSDYKPVRAKVFTEGEMQKFISEAPDDQWLDVKAVCVFGISGALRTDELAKITIGEIEEHGNLLLVKILKTKTKVPRSFTITGEFLNVVRKYAALRVPHTVDTRFFVNYRAGTCTRQAIGKNKFSKMPFRIATYLQLAEANRYTGHSFRRTSATILANTGATMETIKRHGSWRSSKVAEGYLEDSLHYKRKTGELITSTVVSSTTAASQGYVEHTKYHTEIPDNELITSTVVSSTIAASQGYVQHMEDHVDIPDNVLIRTMEDIFDGEDTLHISNDKLSHPINALQDSVVSLTRDPLQDRALKSFNFNNCSVTFNMK